MKSVGLTLAVWAFSVGSAWLLAGCSANNAAAPASLLDSAAREATAIIEQAQATALVLQAQAQATAVVAQANRPIPTSIPAATWMAYVPTAESTPVLDSEPQASEIPTDTVKADTVQVLSVSLAGEGGFIMIRFLAPAKVAERWWQGSVSVQAEEDGTTYNEIPVMPKIGPLIGRPAQDGQPGYVMLVNAPPGLKAGGLATVLLGDYRFEHVPVE